jgi:hypothetical protein
MGNSVGDAGAVVVDGATAVEVVADGTVVDGAVVVGAGVVDGAASGAHAAASNTKTMTGTAAFTGRTTLAPPCRFPDQ